MEHMTQESQLILGLIGGVGAGKSTVLDCLKEHGFYVIQTDLTARRLMEPGMESYEAVTGLLGPAILKEDKTIDRPAMAELIFSDPGLCEQINKLTHPLVWQSVLLEAGQQKGPVVIETALPSKEFGDKCREMWYVYTSREERQKRLEKNRGYSPEKIQGIIQQQPSHEEFFSMADAVIDNNGTAKETQKQVETLLKVRFPELWKRIDR